MTNWKDNLLLSLAALLTTSAASAFATDEDAKPQSKEAKHQSIKTTPQSAGTKPQSAGADRSEPIELDAGRSKARLPTGSRLQEYDEIVSPDMEHSGSLANRARIALRNGNYTRAVELAKKSVQEDDDDPDTHAIYAESIEAKLEHQTEKDPSLYKTCVHEWLLVYRNELGEEKGMTIKGINLMGNWWNDDFRGGLAKKHLKKLTGYLPKAWETDNRYMSRVLKPAETTVTGKVKSVGK